MKLASLLIPILIALAGCVGAPTDIEAATTEAAPVAAWEPFTAEGTVWLPPSTGDAREETLLLFPVNATGSALVADLALGSRYGPVDAPALLTDVLVELRAPDGTVLAEGALNAGATQARLETEATATGEHTLALLSYGGSDEEANGDNVAWRIDAMPQGAGAFS